LRIAFFLRCASALLCLGLASTALQAQTTGRLYDPEPPLDSGYVRILIATGGTPQDLWVDGKPRIRGLAAENVSPYMVLVEGNHTLAFHNAGKPTATLTHTLTVVRGKSLTLAFPSLRADAVPLRFEDKGNTNKLKVMLSAYHLSPKAGPLDITTADGSTKVFTNLAYGNSASLQVNPISVDLVAHPVAAKSALAKASLGMTQGGTYSVFFTAASDGKLKAKSVLNTTERFTGN
jgi:alginate O-acetyltransferase complex protein AlgF